MEKIYLAFLVCIIVIILGIKDLTINKKKNIKYYYSGIRFLIDGIPKILTLTWYYLGGNEWITVFLLCFCFLSSGIYGIWNRKKIKNPLLFRIDVFEFLGGLISLIPVILYLTGYFDKFNK